MKGTTIALVSCMFLGLEPIFGKLLLNYMPPIVVAALTTSTAALILVMILEARHKIWEIGKLTRKEFIVLLMVGLISGLMAQLIYVTGLKESTATNAVLLTRLNSLLIAFFGVIILKEKMTLNHVVGAVLMVLGVVIIATKNFSVEVKPTQGDGLLIIAAVLWAAANILMKKYLSKVPPEVIVIGYNGFSGIILLSMTANQIMPEFNIHVLAYLTGMIVLVSIIGRYLWYFSLEHTDACNVGLASLTIPLFGVFYSVFLLGEVLQTYQLIGGLMVFAGLVAIEIHLTSHSDVEHRLRRHHPHH